VENGSPAGRAGLTVGDTITSIEGKTVTTPDSLSAVTKAHHGGDRVTIVWTGQDGDTHSARVTLADGPAD
jgi:S1-C subfamily serine protease